MKNFYRNHGLVLSCIILATEVIRLATDIVQLMNVVINYTLGHGFQLHLKISA